MAVVKAAASAIAALLPVNDLIAATERGLADQVHALARARAFAEPLIAGETLDSGENTLVHADAVAAILRSLGGSEAMQAASYLVHACVHLNRPREVIAKAFGENFAALAVETTQLMRVQRLSRGLRRRRTWSMTLPCRRRTCARCCWRSRAICAW